MHDLYALPHLLHEIEQRLRVGRLVAEALSSGHEILPMEGASIARHGRRLFH
jgi:hypothetical protein